MDEHDIDPKIWDYLRNFEPELLDRVQRDDPQAQAQLEQKYEGLSELLGLKKKPRPPSERVRTIGPDKRSEALAKVVARVVAEAFPEVAKFRARYLDGQLLPREQIANWIETQRLAEGEPAPVYLTLPVSECRFEGHLGDGTEWTNGGRVGGALTEHRATARSEEEYLAGTRPFATDEYVDFLLRTAERVREGEVLFGDVEHAYPPESRIAVPGGTHAPELACPRASKPLELNYYVPPAESSGWQHVYPKSVVIRGDGQLAELKWLAEQLMDAVPCWLEEHQVVAFILSGWSPRFPRIIGRLRLSKSSGPGRFFGPASRIELNIDPRMTPAAVARFYNESRRQLVVGRDRTMNDKQLALALFADEHGGQDIAWKKLRELWNEIHFEWAYAPTDDPSARRFGLDCRSAWSRLTGIRWPDAGSGRRAREREEQNGQHD
jgi:hypothetical protein